MGKSQSERQLCMLDWQRSAVFEGVTCDSLAYYILLYLKFWGC